MAFLFNEIIYRPVYNLLVFVYNILPWADFGIAIILVTIFIKFLLIPLSKKQIESQKKMQALQPKIKEIQNKYKDDKEKQSKALMEFYKSNKTNPFSGCLPLVVQFIFLIAIYRVLFNISTNSLAVEGGILYSFISNPGQINHLFLGLIDLSSNLNFSQITVGSIAHMILVAAAAAFQYVQTKMLMAKKSLQAKDSKKKKDPDFSDIMSKQMLYLGPILTLFIGVKFPAGLALYWLTSTGFMIVQQILLQKKEDDAKKVIKEN